MGIASQPPELSPLVQREIVTSLLRILAGQIEVVLGVRAPEAGMTVEPAAGVAASGVDQLRDELAVEQQERERFATAAVRPPSSR
ncbi:MAG: hypothetical protein NVSMB25_00060 [Thermoleophilaceae bacterium]